MLAGTCVQTLYLLGSPSVPACPIRVRDSVIYRRRTGYVHMFYGSDKAATPMPPRSRFPRLEYASAL